MNIQPAPTASKRPHRWNAHTAWPRPPSLHLEEGEQTPSHPANNARAKSYTERGAQTQLDCLREEEKQLLKSQALLVLLAGYQRYLGINPKCIKKKSCKREFKLNPCVSSGSNRNNQDNQKVRGHEKVKRSIPPSCFSSVAQQSLLFPVQRCKFSARGELAAWGSGPQLRNQCTSYDVLFLWGFGPLQQVWTPDPHELKEEQTWKLLQTKNRTVL